MMSSRPQTPIAMRQKADIVDLTISPVPVNTTQIEEDEFQVEEGALSTSHDTDIICVGEELDQLIIVCSNNV